MKQLLKIAAAPLFAIVFVATPASAGEYCIGQSAAGIRTCDFDTLAQCQATASGTVGDCFRDPFLTNTPNNALAYLPKHQRSKTVRKPVQYQ